MMRDQSKDCNEGCFRWNRYPRKQPYGDRLCCLESSFVGLQRRARPECSRAPDRRVRHRGLQRHDEMVAFYAKNALSMFTSER